MNGPFVVAQANTSRSGATPVQVIKLIKPEAGHTEIFHASFSGVVKIDFSAIANEKITLFHDSKNQSLHIIFADGSQDIIEPFFDSRGTILSNLVLDMGSGQEFNGERFASQFPITEDISVLPAAGPGGVASGADFHGPFVDGLFTGNPLDLLPPEELPGLQFTITEAPTFLEEAPTFLEQVNLIPAVSGHLFGVVEEEALNRQVEIDFSDSGPGNEDTHDAAGNDHDTSQFGPGSQITTQKFSGALAGLVTGGDLPITFLVNNAANGATVRDENGNPVTSIGLQVHYAAVDSQNIEGRTSDNRLIFTLHVNTDGTFTFTLNDQIDHPTHTHDNGQGFGEETLNLDISNAIIAHDATPDPIVFPTNTIEIGVIDDTPIAFDSAPFYPQPDVEGSGSFSSALDDEDQSHGIQNGPGDNGFGTSVSGILEILPGADNYGSVSFAAGVSVTATDGVNTTSISQLQAIWVDGSGFGHKEDVTLTWVADGSGGGTLTGSTSHLANAFTLTVDKFGDYTFSANAPLAHPFTADPGNPGSSEFEDNLSLVFTYTATDGDGDQVDAHLTINVDDDVPSLFLSSDGSGTVVIHDETPGVQSANGATDVAGGTAITFNGSSTTISALFNSVVNKGSDPDVSHDHGAIGFAQGLNGLASVVANFGADGAALTQSEVFSFLLPKGDGTFSGLYTTEGEGIYLFLENGVVVGRYDAPNDGNTIVNQNDPAAFAITVDPTTGEAYIAQYVSLNHPDQATAADGFDSYNEAVSLALGTVSIAVTVTDGDGDSVTQTADVSGEIQFLDDGPIVSVKVDSGTLIIDETAGQDAGTNDVATTPALLALFAALPGTPIQIAQSGAALFTTSGSAFGADGPSAPPNSVFGLNVVDGTDSGLNATDGRSIYLYHQGNLIVGREGDVGTDAPNAAGPVALAFSIDSGTGMLTVAEYTAIQHPNPLDPNEAGSPQTITNSALQVTFTLTDGDGDTSTASAGIGSLIQFRDDGPSVTPQSNLIVNGSFEEGHTNLSGADWDIYTSLPGWTAGPDHVPFEVQTGGVGGIAAEDGVALIELDGDTTGNPAHQPPSGTPDPLHTDATIQQVVSGTQAGVDYELTFWYTPRPGHSSGDDDGLNVLWNGNVVDTINSTGQPEGVWQQITVFVTGTGPGDTLGFQGAGDADEFGALIDNVTLVQAVVVDEDGLPKGNHDSQPGDIVVPNTDGDNNEATSTGQLNINWGADNFDTAPDTHVSGNPALGFAQDSGGRSLTFTNTIVGITGGTLTSHGDAITLTLSADHTVLTGTAQHGADPVRTVFEVSLSDDNTGAFRFILEDALDHATDNNENNIALSFNFTATDSDGDTALGDFQVLVNDDMPVAVNDVNSAAGVGSVATGNVITGVDFVGGDSNTTDGNADHVGADQPGAITQVVGFGGTVNTADPSNNFHVTGQFGTLLLNEDGDYSYTRTSSSAGTDVFTYTLSDDDGDTSTATLTINLDGSRLDQRPTFTGTVEEEELGNTASPPLFPSSFVGNEDTTSALGNDADTTGNFHITTNVTTNTFIVFGGTGPYTYSFAGGIEGTQAQTHSPNPMTSHGAPVYFHIDSGNPNLLIGYADGVGGTADSYDAGIDRVVFTFQINPTTGQGTFSLYDNIDHHQVAAADDVEGTRVLNLNGIVEATDSSPSPQTLLLNGSIAIIDDIPVAQGDAARVDEGGTGTTNFLITIDTSASMLDDPGVPGFTTRFALEKAALITMLNSTNVNEVFIVNFSTAAGNSGAWLSKAAAITYINGLTAGGFTNYDAALTDAETAFTHAHTSADQTLAYFLSDGEPNLPFLSVGISPSEQATWENFLTTNAVTESFAIGVGNGATLSALDPTAFPNGDPNNPVVLTDEGQLAGTLIGSLPGIISGNVLTNDHFGADGPLGAGILSITIDGHVYAYNPGSNAITEDGNPFAAGTGTLDVNTALGGHLDFHFTSGVGFSAGNYTYSSPPNVNTDTSEIFHYVIADGDGDKVGADLTVTVVAVNDPPVAHDDTVITNISGSGAAIAIPDAALILNDTDIDGPSLSILSVGSATSGFVGHAGTATTFTDNNSNGGAFIYTLHDNGTPDLTDTANVTVDRSQAGNSTIKGTSSGEILLDRAGGNDTLVGNGGSDVLIGGDGNDHFLYNATTDGPDHILDFGNGADSIDFSHTAFGNGLAVGGLNTGTLDPSHFVSGATEGAFAGSGPGFFFNTTDHTLYYDSNGNAAAGQIAMAKLENNHALVSAEIHVV